MTTNNVQLVGVCGSGIMGAGLAEVVARAGVDVIVRSRTIDGAKSMLSSIEKNLDKQVAKEKMTVDQRNEVLSHIRITDSLMILRLATSLLNQSLKSLGQSKHCSKNLMPS